MVEFKQEIREINQNLNEGINTINLQNLKISEVDLKLEEVNNKAKITNKYLKGFKSIFSFLPSIFSWSRQKKESPKTSTDQDVGINSIDKEEDLENEIYNLNNNAKKLRDQIDKSLIATQNLENRVDKSSSTVNKLVESAKKVYKK
jgi:hypothetical protein